MKWLLFPNNLAFLCIPAHHNSVLEIFFTRRQCTEHEYVLLTLRIFATFSFLWFFVTNMTIQFIPHHIHRWWLWACCTTISHVTLKRFLPLYQDYRYHSHTCPVYYLFSAQFHMYLSYILIPHQFSTGLTGLAKSCKHGVFSCYNQAVNSDGLRGTYTLWRPTFSHLPRCTRQEVCGSATHG